MRTGFNVGIVIGAIILAGSCKELAKTSDTNNDPEASAPGATATPNPNTYTNTPPQVEGIPGALQLAIAAAFPVGLAIKTAEANLVAETPVAPIMAGTLTLNPNSLLLKSLLLKKITLTEDMPPIGGPCEMFDEDNISSMQNNFSMCLQSKTYTERLNFQKEMLAGTPAQCWHKGWFETSTPSPMHSCANGGHMGIEAGDTGKQPPILSPENRICGVEAAREKIADAALAVEVPSRLLLAAICQSKKDGENIELPTSAGEVIDIKPYLAKAMQLAGDTSVVDSAQVVFLFNEDSKPVVRTDIALSGLSVPEVRPNISNYKVHLVHVPPGENSADYHGTLWATWANSMSPAKSIYAVRYAQTGDTSENVRLKFEIRGIAALADGADTEDYFITDKGILDFNKGVSDDNWTPPTPENCDNHHANWEKYGNHPNDFTFAGGYILVRGDVNPWTQEGSLSINQNPGSGYFERAFSVHYNMSKQESGKLAGCVNVGSMENLNGSPNASFPEDKCSDFPKSIRLMLRTGMPTYPNGSRIGSEKYPQIYQQCFIQNEAGQFILDSSKMSAEQLVTGYIKDLPENLGLINVTMPSIPDFIEAVK